VSGARWQAVAGLSALHGTDLTTIQVIRPRLHHLVPLGEPLRAVVGGAFWTSVHLAGPQMDYKPLIIWQMFAKNMDVPGRLRMSAKGVNGGAEGDHSCSPFAEDRRLLRACHCPVPRAIPQ